MKHASRIDELPPTGIMEREDLPFEGRVSRSKIQEHLEELRALRNESYRKES